MFKSETAAKKASSKAYNPVVVRFADGSFDWFPQGQPIGRWVNGVFEKIKDAVIVARYSFGKWR